ncbi:MAG: hypothetical protein KF757_04255 [Phycisphaeraceae bacterium]|nr:hypothetical protein [Phycisphaeraceae bacterium]MCW5764193.1 hypothetical protein [Phycisphaeraceae bacterium]
MLTVKGSEAGESRFLEVNLKSYYFKEDRDANFVAPEEVRQARLVMSEVRGQSARADSDLRRAEAEHASALAALARHQTALNLALESEARNTKKLESLNRAAIKAQSDVTESNSKVEQATINKGEATERVVKQAVQVRAIEDAFNVRKTAYRRATESTTDRNRLIADLMHLSERIAVIHLSSILAAEDMWEISLGTARNSLAGLAAVLDPSGTTRGLAAGAAFAGATGDLLRSELYAKSFATAIVRACDDERRDYRISMESRMTQTIDKYPIDLALVDLVEYHKRGSFWHGLSVVVERASTPEDLAALKTEAERNSLIAQASVKRITLVTSLDRVRRTMGAEEYVEVRSELNTLFGDEFRFLSRSMTLDGLRHYNRALEELQAKLDQSVSGG